MGTTVLWPCFAILKKSGVVVVWPEEPPRATTQQVKVCAPDDVASSSVCCVKPSWSNVQGFANASRELREMARVRWMSVLTIKQPEDWELARQYSRWIRELRCLDGSLTHPYQRVFTDFEHLRTVSIDAHSDIFRNHRNQFTYRDLFLALPPSLRRLEVTRAHGPDIKIIATAKQHCPDLEELRLGRCTIFNCPSPCDFWQSFPFDHDSYISCESTNAYAHSLSQELFPLKSLKSLRIGLYLIPSTTVLAHRAYHRRGLLPPPVIEWQQAIQELHPPVPDAGEEPPPELVAQLVALLHEADPESEFGPQAVCAMCVDAVETICRDAQNGANEILRDMLPSLEKVQWMSWLSAGHLGLDCYSSRPHKDVAV